MQTPRTAPGRLFLPFGDLMCKYPSQGGAPRSKGLLSVNDFEKYLKARRSTHVDSTVQYSFRTIQMFLHITAFD